MTVKKLEEITGKFCDRYCTFSRIFCHEDEQDKLDEICKSCPMNEMFELLDMLQPCNIDDDVWVIPTKENKLPDITKMKCIGFILSKDSYCANFVTEKNKLYQPSFDEFGKTVFLNYSEAEKNVQKRS